MKYSPTVDAFTATYTDDWMKMPNDFIARDAFRSLPDADRVMARQAAADVRHEAYTWAGTYSAGSDAIVYRRYKGALPAYAERYACRPPPAIVAFCEEHGCDLALYDELHGVVRKPRLGTDEAP